VVPVEGALYEFRHLLEHHILPRRGCEYLVELESVILTDVLAEDGEALPVGEDVDGGIPNRGAVRGQEGPRANVNADVPPQLLDAIVQRAAHLIAAQELLLELRDPAIALLDLRLEDGWVLVGGAAFALGGLARAALQDAYLEKQPLLARPPVFLLCLQVGLRADLDLLEVGAPSPLAP
jgi:hypothetical protein